MTVSKIYNSNIPIWMFRSKPSLEFLGKNFNEANCLNRIRAVFFKICLTDIVITPTSAIFLCEGESRSIRI